MPVPIAELRVIEDPGAASAALDPVRNLLLSEVRAFSGSGNGVGTGEGVSAATLAGRVGLPRQKVNYHLRTLEKHGLVRFASRRKWGGLTERRLVATATSYVVSPAALGPVGPPADPARRMDRLSAGYLVALAARVVREVGQLMRASEETGKRLATLSVDTEVVFRSASDRAAFTQELTAAVATLVARYHAEDPPPDGHSATTGRGVSGEAGAGRRHRLMIGAYPISAKSENKEAHQ